MKKWLLPITLLICCPLVAQQTESLTRIAFGSCTNEEISDQMWSEIISQKPQLCILLGDNIYGDTHNMDSLRSQYHQQKWNPDYQQLLRQCPVIGTWDDHDYGQNDGGKFYSKKNESKEEFLRFMDISASDPVRTHPGVYSSHTYGPAGKKVKVILLDLRTFRDTTIRSTIKGRRYEANPDGDIMGEEQWAWFEKEISASDASIHIIGSSIQFISTEHGWEKWGNFPKSRQRMLDLLVKYKIKKPLFLSGDRHIAEVSKMSVPGLPYPLYDITSSGLTHTWDMKGQKDMPVTEVNKFRIGKFIVQKNFGMMVIDWSDNEPIIFVEIRGKGNALWDIPVVIR